MNNDAEVLVDVINMTGLSGSNAEAPKVLEAVQDCRLLVLIKEESLVLSLIPLQLTVDTKPE